MRYCEECSRCIVLGEGDHICDDSMELVLIDYVPTKAYGQCIDNNDEEE